MVLPKPHANKAPALKALFDKAYPWVLEGKCATCKDEIKEEDFTDDLSIKEYGICGMCQKCQNKVYGE